MVNVIMILLEMMEPAAACPPLHTGPAKFQTEIQVKLSQTLSPRVACIS